MLNEDRINPKRGRRQTWIKRRKINMFLVDLNPTEDVSDTEINNYLIRALKHTRIKSRLPVSHWESRPFKVK